MKIFKFLFGVAFFALFVWAVNDAMEKEERVDFVHPIVPPVVREVFGGRH